MPTTDFGSDLDAAERKVEEALHSVSIPATQRVMKQAETFTSHWLFRFGVPNSPRELLQFASAGSLSTLGACIMQDDVTLTPAGKATDDERAQSEREVEELKRSLASLAKNRQQPTVAAEDPRPGGYL